MRRAHEESAPPRLFTECPYWTSVADGTSAECGLIRRIAGDLPIESKVDGSVCEACYRQSVDRNSLNSVVASHLFAATCRFIETAPCTQQRRDAEFLKSFAEQHLETVDCDNVRLPMTGYSGPRSLVPVVPRRRPFLESLRRVANRWPRIGLVGWNTRTGLGYQNRDIAQQLPIKRWLALRHPQFTNLPAIKRLRNATLVPSNEPSDSELRSWLSGLDWVLFVENPLFQRITRLAKELGVRVAAVCNWEWTCLIESTWLQDVDLTICPTQYTRQLMCEWKSRFFPAWNILHFPWPIDAGRFPFRPRVRCNRFVFINGTGGTRARRPDGSMTPYHRKGLEVVFQAARLVPDLPFIVYSQHPNLPAVPPNVTLRNPPSDNRALFDDGDVCIQPSHWEGLGLQLLECQAAGMPLITTDSPPMNEYQPMRTIPVSSKEIVHLAGKTPVSSCLIDPRDLATVLREVHGSDIQDESFKARRFVKQHHDWNSARKLIRRAMNDFQ